jgi:hypothetical protein
VKPAVVVPESPSVTVASATEIVFEVCGVSEKSSTPSPSSAPVTLKSAQRIQNVCPGAIESPVIAPATAVRLPAAFPFSAPTVPVVTGEEKSSAFTSTQPEAVVRLVAVRLYSRSRRSGPRPTCPRRHCSPVYPMSSEEIVRPVSLVNAEPISGISVR